ncbi:hypothetical protein VDGD_06581 [Verticillium dahliae]|nr:hypothetical protein VDGD_06581 [Verticillium dahliae]
MAPPSNLGKRVKGTQVCRPFIYGTTAIPFGPQNPKPPGVPDDHTHSWQVFVKGLDDTDITYWLRRIQFKLHESIPNHVRMIDAEPGKPFVVNETGWGEFEITLKLYYATESGEKPQTLYHHLRLHPYGRTEEEKEEMRTGNGEVRAWIYEDQLFSEPYETFYEILTSGAHPKGHPGGAAAAGAGAGAGKAGGGGGAGKGKTKALPPLPDKNAPAVWERTAIVPAHSKPGHEFSRDTEQLEIKKLKDAQDAAQKLCKSMLDELKDKEAQLARLKEENAAAAATAAAAQAQAQAQAAGQA